MVERLKKQKDGLYLYRNVIPPGVDNLAFVGAEVSTFNNVRERLNLPDFLA